jgi:hypothetical protein
MDYDELIEGIVITPDMDPARRAVLEAMRRRYEEARDEERARKLTPKRTRKITGPSVVFSVRLDPEELAALERRATKLHMRPTTLARACIRTGIARSGRGDIADALDRLEAAMQELRAAAAG